MCILGVRKFKFNISLIYLKKLKKLQWYLWGKFKKFKTVITPDVHKIESLFLVLGYDFRG